MLSFYEIAKGAFKANIKRTFEKKMNLENTEEKLNLLSDKAYSMEKNSLNVIQKTYHEQLENQYIYLVTNFVLNTYSGKRYGFIGCKDSYISDDICSFFFFS